MRAALADMAQPADGKGWTLAMDARPGAAWLQGFAEAGAVPPRHRQAHHHMLQSIAWPAAFATLRVGARWPGSAWPCWSAGAWACMTSSSHLQCAGGAGPCAGVRPAALGTDAGAQWAELQVRAPNRVARGLYESLGFHPLYAYHYRLPAAAP